MSTKILKKFKICINKNGSSLFQSQVYSPLLHILLLLLCDCLLVSHWINLISGICEFRIDRSIQWIISFSRPNCMIVDMMTCNWLMSISSYKKIQFFRRVGEKNLLLAELIVNLTSCFRAKIVKYHVLKKFVTN